MAKWVWKSKTCKKKKGLKNECKFHHKYILQTEATRRTNYPSKSSFKLSSPLPEGGVSEDSSAALLPTICLQLLACFQLTHFSTSVLGFINLLLALSVFSSCSSLSEDCVVLQDHKEDSVHRHSGDRKYMSTTFMWLFIIRAQNYK